MIAQYSGTGQIGGERALLQAQAGFYGFAAQGHLIAPHNRDMRGPHCRHRQRHRVAHPGGRVLHDDFISARNACLQLCRDVAHSVGRKYEDQLRAVGQQEIEQPVENRPAGDRVENFRPVEAEPRAAAGGRNDRGPLAWIDPRAGGLLPVLAIRFREGASHKVDSSAGSSGKR